MADIVIIGENLARADAYGLALSDAGHEVEIFSDQAVARARLGRDPAQIAVIEVASTDGGPGLLVSQTKSAWPECLVIALTSSRDVETSKLREMGLWEPDLSLALPVAPARLVQAVQKLLNLPGQKSTGEDGACCA